MASRATTTTATTWSRIGRITKGKGEKEDKQKCLDFKEENNNIRKVDKKRYLSKNQT